MAELVAVVVFAFLAPPAPPDALDALTRTPRAPPHTKGANTCATRSAARSKPTAALAYARDHELSRVAWVNSIERGRNRDVEMKQRRAWNADEAHGLGVSSAT